MSLTRRGLLAGLFGVGAAAVTARATKAFAFFDPVSLPRNSLRLLEGEWGTRYGVEFYTSGSALSDREEWRRLVEGKWIAEYEVLRNSCEPRSYSFEPLELPEGLVPYAGVKFEPPLHPNCRSATAAVLKASERELELAKEGAVRGVVNFTGSIHVYYPGDRVTLHGLSQERGPLECEVVDVVDSGSGRGR